MPHFFAGSRFELAMPSPGAAEAFLDTMSATLFGNGQDQHPDTAHAAHAAP